MQSRGYGCRQPWGGPLLLSLTWWPGVIYFNSLGPYILICKMGIIWRVSRGCRENKRRSWRGRSPEPGRRRGPGALPWKCLLLCSFRKAPSHVWSPLSTRQHTDTARPQGPPLVSGAAWDLRLYCPAMNFGGANQPSWKAYAQYLLSSSR